MRGRGRGKSQVDQAPRPEAKQDPDLAEKEATVCVPCRPSPLIKKNLSKSFRDSEAVKHFESCSGCKGHSVPDRK